MMPAGPLLPTPTSATGVTPVTTGGVTLFVGFGSLVGELTLAELVRKPATGAVTVMFTLLTRPLGESPGDHVHHA